MDDQGKDHYNQKWPQKGTASKNYRPITYLTMMWEILTAQIREEIYYSLMSNGLVPKKTKDALSAQEQ